MTTDRGVPYLPSKNIRFQKGYEKCVYGWADLKKWKLVCATHGTSHPSIIVMNWLGAGSETLLDLLDEGMLTGEALKDAGRLAEERKFLAGL